MWLREKETRVESDGGLLETGARERERERESARAETNEREHAGEMDEQRGREGRGL